MRAANENPPTRAGVEGPSSLEELRIGGQSNKPGQAVTADRPDARASAGIPRIPPDPESHRDGCECAYHELLRSGSGSGSEPAAAPAVVLTSLETSVLRNPLHGTDTDDASNAVEPRPYARFEARRRKKLASERARWMARAQEMGQAGDRGREIYAAQRAAALGRDLEPTVARCGTTKMPMVCNCPPAFIAAYAASVQGRRKGAVKPTQPVAYTCKQHLVCDGCNDKRWKRTRARMAEGLTLAMNHAKEQYRRAGCPKGGRPQIVLLTMTIAHSGDVGLDRERLQESWRRFYKSLWRHGWKAPYCGAWEATSGKDGPDPSNPRRGAKGHVHLHVAIIWPKIEWSVVSALWRSACPWSRTIDMAWRRKDRRPTNGWSAANYIGKYISKGVDLESMDQELAADIVAASYNQRSIISSRGFFQKRERPACPCCDLRPWPVRVFHPVSVNRALGAADATEAMGRDGPGAAWLRARLRAYRTPWAQFEMETVTRPAE